MCFRWHISRSYRFVAEVTFKPNLGGIFRGSFCGGGAKITPCLKLVSIILETWNLVPTYTSTKTPFIFADVSTLQKTQFFGKNSFYTQSSNMRAVLDFLVLITVFVRKKVMKM